MRKVLLIGAGLGMFALSGVAMAQTPPATPPAAGDQSPPTNPAPQMPPPDGHGPMQMGRGPMGMRGPFGGPDRMMGMMRMMQRDQAARFHFYSGDRGIDIRCAANESTQACVSAAGTLMDKLGTMQRPGQ